MTQKITEQSDHSDKDRDESPKIERQMSNSLHEGGEPEDNKDVVLTVTRVDTDRNLLVTDRNTDRTP